MIEQVALQRQSVLLEHLQDGGAHLAVPALGDVPANPPDILDDGIDAYYHFFQDRRGGIGFEILEDRVEPADVRVKRQVQAMAAALVLGLLGNGQLAGQIKDLLEERDLFLGLGELALTQARGDAVYDLDCGHDSGLAGAVFRVKDPGGDQAH